MTDFNGNETLYDYDSAGNVTSRKDLSGFVTYRYNSRNLIEEIAFNPKESRTEQLFKYTYDPRGFNSKITHPDGAQTQYDYDDLGRLCAIQTGETLIMSYEYNDFDLKTKAVTRLADTAIEETYTYDEVGRLAVWTKDGQTTHYEYDSAYNRIGVSALSGSTAYLYNPLNQLISDGDSEYDYDSNGNLIRIRNNDATDLSWDPLNRLIGYKTGEKEIAHTYDPLNRMLTRNDTVFNYAGLANQFVVQSESGHDTAYLYDMNGSPLAWYSQNRPYAFLKNAHHDVVGFSGEDGLTDIPNGAPFGGRAKDIQFGFQGQYSDAESGFSRLNNRLYNPETAQFLSPDPYPATPANPETINRYAYSHNDPVNYWDVTGLYNMEVHYYKTKDWAYDAAMAMGFSYNMSRQLALNISSFDQYHDKEWSLAPNNYAMGNGQGNALHFPNPDRQQVSYTGNVAQPGKGPFTIATINAGNEYSDNMTVTVGKTIIPVFEMKSLSEFNTSAGADKLINNPNAIHGDFLYNLTLKGGTPRERLQYAVDSHDPRLFGIAMHEYQDSFAHAGFDLWHGTSKESDFYCASEIDKDYCKGKVVTSTYRGSTDGSTGTITTFDSKYVTIDAQLLERDRLMQIGTEYWMKKFMEDQADYYKKAIYDASNASRSFNKMEKMIAPKTVDGIPFEVNSMLRANEKEEDYYWYINGGISKKGVFAEQSAWGGDVPCLTINGFNPDSDPGCGVFISDSLKQINRK